MVTLNKTIDEDGDKLLTTSDGQRTYEKVIFKTPLELIVAFGKYNRVIPVVMNVSYRKGTSIYGDQIVWQLIYNGDDKTLKEVWDRKKYVKKSPENHIEFYFSGDVKKKLNKINKLVE